MTIQLGSDREEVDIYGVTRVLLENASPNAVINYLDGTANGTVLSAQGQSVQASAQESYGESSSSQGVSQFASPDQSSPQQAGSENRIVFVTGHGNSEVYWYNKANMPSNTKLENVVEMTEAEAQFAGKRHSMTE
ncbi:hypothetical protein [Streptococcus bovimastitidis]|uniref:hypothetical protein n=1 Tax=Streptococcus bovimastitidis TaxID=1856638 RepID=UPI001F0A1436|nr:hypothetical protein [Streptococcus bovimastitidis]